MESSGGRRLASLHPQPAGRCATHSVGGKLVGEGFDHPALDTLVLAMPVSWKGTLQQYAGRLHREYSGKTDVRIIDFVDTGHPALLRMWERRQRGYRAMGYRVKSGDVSAS
jgi:superfamily II DNA or RNA helicase